MDVFKKKWKKTVERWRSINHRKRGGMPELSKSRSWPSILRKKNTGSSTPQGCFAVYVGPERQRFVVSAEQSGHPLFLNLLEDAVTEYGHDCQGPLLLPCHVDLFCKVLAQMDSADEVLPSTSSAGCSGVLIRSPRSRKGYSPLSPSRMLKLNQF